MREEVIGTCRLLQGDARDIVPGITFDSIITDPPYGMSFQSGHRKALGQHRPIANDHNDDLLVWACGLPITHSAYIFARWDNLRSLPPPTSLITWVKNNWSMGDLEHEHARQTEVALFYRGPDHHFPTKRPSDVIKCDKTGNEHHPTEKPVELMRVMVKWTAGTVLDCFMGSGTTGVACAKLQRDFIGIELDQTHFDTACRRIEAAHRQPELFVEWTEPVQTGLKI